MRPLPLLLSLYLIAGFGLISTCAASGDPAPISKAVENVAPTDWFKELEKTYPQHFKLPLRNGGWHIITSDDTIGKFLSDAITRRSKIGKVVFKTEVPEQSGFRAFGQCVADKAAGEIQIRICKRVTEPGFGTDKFWQILIFEIFNSLRIEEYEEIKNNYSTRVISRDAATELLLKFEHHTSILTNSFYRSVWVKYISDNKIKVGADAHAWFFGDDISFERWILALESKEEGRKFLRFYRHPAVVKP